MNLKRRWGREMGTKIVDTNSVVFKNKRWSCAVIENIIEVHPFHAHCRVIKKIDLIFSSTTPCVRTNHTAQKSSVG